MYPLVDIRSIKFEMCLEAAVPPEFRWGDGGCATWVAGALSFFAIDRRAKKR
jgi:hypothetical protein